MEAIKDIVVKHLKVVQEGIAANMQQQHRTTSGRSVASLRIEDEGAEGLAHVFLTGDKQWEVMERGRGPGKVPYRFSEIIKEWIVKKGINYRQLAPKNASPERGLASLSYMIAHSIMKKGTKLHRDKGYNDIYDTLLEEETEKLALEATGIVETEIDKINDKDDENN